jgi:flavorubredoxin
MAAREINRGCRRTGITCTTERAGFGAALNSRMPVIALSAGSFLIAGFLREHHHASVFDAALGDDVVCGAEIGLRTKLIPKLESSVSLFLLDSASEILFSGDAGDTSASRPSRRYGVEWTNDYRPL